MGKQYSSRLMASIHETAEGLHSAGVMDKRTMREFDDLCLTPVRPLKQGNPRAPSGEGASQAVFARYLNVTTGLVSQWERGEKQPSRRFPQAPCPRGQERAQCGCMVKWCSPLAA